MKRTEVCVPGCAAAEDEFGNKIRRAAGRLSQWHAESEKILGVHRELESVIKLQSDMHSHVTD